MARADSDYLTPIERYRERLPPGLAHKGIGDDFELREISQSRTYNRDLCETCQHINFESLLKRGVTAVSDNFAVLGEISHILRNADEQRCSFCHLIIHTISCVLGTETNVPTTHGSRVVKVGLQRQRANRSANDMYEIAVHLYPTDVVPYPQSERITIHTCVESRYTAPQVLMGRIIPGLRVDFSLLRRWLDVCETWHMRAFDEEGPPASKHFRLVDVTNRCVVRAQLNWRYLAVSYVWGSTPQPVKLCSSNASRLEEKESLVTVKDQLPQTIKDAIDLTEALGERFVWVDSLCIIQDDRVSKEDQIASMHLIYGAAVLTIAAAYGRDAASGLPGVQPGSRTSSQRVERIGELKLCNKLPGLLDLLDGAPWNSRGWTYQERHLSRRLLVFTDRQVYFKCAHGSCCEDVFSGAEMPDNSSSSSISPSNGPPDGLLRRSTNFHCYEMAVSEYSRRSLSNQDDALNAFSGAIAQFRSVFRSDCLQGLPVTELNLALLWYPTGRVNRRRDEQTGDLLFSSWSWLGWQGPVKYIQLSNSASMVQWVNQNPKHKGHTFTSEEYRGQNLPYCQDWEATVDELGVPSFRDPQQSSLPFLHPTAPEHVRPIYMYATPGRPLQIQFWAYAAFFRITGTHAPKAASVNIPPCEGSNHTICPVILFSSKGNHAGVIHLPVEKAANLPTGNYEIIALSLAWTEGTHTRSQPPPPSTDIFNGTISFYQEGRWRGGNIFGFDNDIYTAGPWCRYNVLMIERKADVAFRIGIGLVHVAAFHEAEPQRRLIKLE